MLYIFIIIFALVIGSFLNVCIVRIPRGESVAYPPSHCGSCGTRLRAIDLIPVLSWLFLRGKCRYCRTSISYQYPLVELLTAVLFVFVFTFTGRTNSIFLLLLLTSILIVISFIDYKYLLIPNKVIIVGFGLGFLAHLLFPTICWQNIVLGILVGGGSLYFLAVLSGGGMGGGDIKLAALIGFYLGWQKVLLALFFGALVGSVFGLVMLLSQKITGKDPIPFGPFLSFGVFMTIFLY